VYTYIILHFVVLVEKC